VIREVAVRVLISGASGLVGAALGRSLRADGHEVGRLVRGTPSPPDDVAWDPDAGPDPARLRGWDAVMHLAGKNLATLWTPGNRRLLYESRVAGTRGVAEAIAAAGPDGPRVLVSASAVGWYGSRGDETLTEASSPGEGFLAGLCRDWEAACEPARAAGARVAHARFGLVLASDGGPLAKMLLPFRLGLGGRVGSGRQWVSWVVREDAARALGFLLERDDAAGPFNVAAPEPVRNEELARELGRALRRPAVLPVPAAALRLLPGGMGDQTLLASQRAVPARLAEAGFRFRFERLPDALGAVLAGRS
jgi:uncharacterized protein (TIGR01777 family)